MEKTNNHQTGLSLGILFTLMHGLWLIVVALDWGETFLSWWLSLHFVEDSYRIINLNLTTAILGLLAAFGTGYLIGWFFALIFNWGKK